MKKKFSILFFSLVISQFGYSQYRIALDRSNTFKYQLSYLIDVPYNGDIKCLYLDNRNEVIPAAVLFSEKNRLWATLDTLFVLEKSSIKKVKQIQTNTYKVQVDKYIVLGYGNPIKQRATANEFLTHKKLSSSVLPDPAFVRIYYFEQHGSNCCPKDTTPSLDIYINKFEEKYNVKVGDRYVIYAGKEGESADYLTLNGLTPAQKIEFIDNRHYDMIPNKKTTQIARVSSIFMPFLVSKKYLRIDH